MKEIKSGINDRNQVFLEGTIHGAPKYQTAPSGKGALNVVIEQRKYIGGEPRYFYTEVVLFEPLCDLYKDVLKDQMFISATGHLISQDIVVGEGENSRVIKSQKAVIVHLEFTE